MRCQEVHIYLLQINSTFLIACLMVMARIVQKIMLMFLACAVHASELGTRLAFSLLEDSKQLWFTARDYWAFCWSI
jgi:hypothetical protein